MALRPVSSTGSFRALPLLFLLPFVTGCAKFKSSRKADLGPFAELTIATVSNLEADLGRNRRIHLIEYAKPLEHFRSAGEKHIDILEKIIDGIVEYSLVIGRISRDDIGEEDRVRQLADYLATFRADSTDPEERAIIAESVACARAQETLLGALECAQPMVNDAARAAAVQSMVLIGLAREFDAEMDAAIGADFADVLGFQGVFEGQRASLLGALSAVYRFRSGDEGALDPVLSDATLGLDEELRLRGPSFATADALEQLLVARLDRLMTVSDRLGGEYERYAMLHRELDEIVESFKRETRTTWSLIFIWSRAHDRMARGTVDPAAWFDMTDAPSSAFRLARLAI